MNTQFIIVVLLMGGAAPFVCACADVLWDNGEWDRAKAISSERDTLVPESWLVDDFVVHDTVVLRQLEWLALKSTDARPTGVDCILLSDVFDPVIERFDLEYASEPDGTAFGHEVHRLTLSGIDVTIDPGRYYIGARFVGDGIGRAFAAGQFTLHGATEAYFRSDYFGYPDWVPTRDLGITPSDAVFKVYGDVIPAPATLAVLLSGLAVSRPRR